MWCLLWALKALLLCHLNHMTWSAHQNVVEIRFLLWWTQPVRSCLCCCGSTKAGMATVAQGWLQGQRGSSGPATWCIWNPPTHIPSIHSMTRARRNTNEEKGELGSLGISFLFEMTFDIYLTYLMHLHYSPESLNALPESHWGCLRVIFHSFSKFLLHSPLRPQQLHPVWPANSFCWAWSTPCPQ